MNKKNKKTKYKGKHNRKITRKNRNLDAGKAIDAGGFGCVFRPQIKCKNSRKKEKVDGITKLMSSQDADNEWKELKNIKKVVSNIPNYEKYFLLKNIELCYPNELDNDDLVSIEKCKNAFHNVGINLDQINSNLDKFKIINMPYGGENLVNLISNDEIPFSKVNNLLIKLLENGIVPMNKLAFYHCDIKGQNILYKEDNLRLIDWGISTYLEDSHLKEIPNSLSNYKIQFNSPFSRIIFNKYFDEFVFNYLTARPDLNVKNDKLFLELELMMLSFYEKYITITGGTGHEDFINIYLVPELFKLNSVEAPKELNYTAILFSQYMIKILVKYLDFKNKKVDKLEYLNDVYLKNLDVWGFIFVYVEYIINSNVERKLKVDIANLIIKYCYSVEFSDKPINIGDLVKELKNLDSEKSRNMENNEKIVNLKKMFSI